MTDFEEMISQMQLKDIETEIKKQLTSIQCHKNRMKLAVFLSILTDESFKVLDKIDLTMFVKQLYERLDKQIKEYQEKMPILETHRIQNFAITNNISEATSRLVQLNNEIEHLLSDYDTMLSELVKARDLLPLEDLNKK